jgi:hypothetical protein
MMQLSLGTFQLERTPNAVTAEQASKLLPFWQGLLGGSIQNRAETNAVLKQIESTMTAEQLEAIAAMQLTFESMNSWAESNGIEMPQFGPRGGGEGQNPFGDMTEEERAKFREEMQSLSSEERRERLAEMGIEVPSGGEGGPDGQGPRPGGRFNVFMDPLTELLTARAAE